MKKPGANVRDGAPRVISARLMRRITDSRWPDRYLVRRGGFGIEPHAHIFGKEGETSMRLVQRSSILVLGCALAMPLVACGGSGGGDNTQVVDPNGKPHTYVVDRVLLPTQAGDGTKYGLDLDGDGNVDNALGSILSALSSAASGNLNLQSSIDDSVNEGKLILLTNLKATALDAATGVALEVYVADTTNVMPAPCTDPTMIATCGQHLKGTGKFAIASTSPMNAQVVGKILGGQFTGGPGNITVAITLSSTVGTPIQLNLIGARAKIPGISATGLGSDASPGVLAGGITQNDLNTQVIPAVATTVSAQVTRDCDPTMKATLPPCGCKSGSTGATVISLFDKSPADCMITVDEIKNNSLIQTLLEPDVMLDDGTGTKVPCLSVGVGVTAVPGTFTVPAGQ
jgi:hypothetical protein